MNSCVLPIVCVCVPTYNAGGTLSSMLDSILAQTYREIFVLVVDNASEDNTLEIADAYAAQDNRVRVMRNTLNVGGEGNFNRCIQLARGKYTAIFHADDMYEPDMVAKQVAFLEFHSEAGAVFTEASLIDERGRRVGEIRLPKSIKPKCGLYDFETLFKAVLRHSNFFICPSFMIRTQVYQEEIKAWRGELFGSGADLDVWLRLLQYHPIGCLKERLVRYRISRHQWSARVRLETEPSALFKIVDHYLEREEVRKLLSRDDLRNYKWLERRDRVMRAVNLILADRAQNAKALVRDIFSEDAFRAAVLSSRGLFTLLAGAYVRLMLLMGLHGIGKRLIFFMKKVTFK